MYNNSHTDTIQSGREVFDSLNIPQLALESFDRASQVILSLSLSLYIYIYMYIYTHIYIYICMYVCVYM